MDNLKRSLVSSKLSFDIRNNIIEKEVHQLGYTSIYTSSYLARLLFSNQDYKFDYKINDNIIHAYSEKDNEFINVTFLEYGYNFTSYFKNNYKYLNDSAKYFKQYLIDNNLEKELDAFVLSWELSVIDNIIDYCIHNNMNTAIYNHYFYFFEPRSILSKNFEIYMNSYINTNYNINFQYKISSVLEFLPNISDRNILDRLEYYDLFSNGLSYEKIFTEAIKIKDLSIDGLLSKYSISTRTATIIWDEYEIYKSVEKQDSIILKIVSTKCDLDNIDESYIRSLYHFSSSILSKLISNRFINRLFDLLLKLINNGYYDKQVNIIRELLNTKENDDKKSNKLLSFITDLEKIKKGTIENESNKLSMLQKYVDKIKKENGELTLELYPINKFIKIKTSEDN